MSTGYIPVEPLPPMMLLWIWVRVAAFANSKSRPSPACEWQSDRKEEICEIWEMGGGAVGWQAETAGELAASTFNTKIDIKLLVTRISTQSANRPLALCAQPPGSVIDFYDNSNKETLPTLSCRSCPMLLILILTGRRAVSPVVSGRLLYTKWICCEFMKDLPGYTGQKIMKNHKRGHGGSATDWKVKKISATKII